MCEIEFESHQTDRAKYCSEKCRGAAQRKRLGAMSLDIIRICEICKGEYKPKATHQKVCYEKPCRKKAEQIQDRKKYLKRIGRL